MRRYMRIICLSMMLLLVLCVPALAASDAPDAVSLGFSVDPMYWSETNESAAGGSVTAGTRAASWTSVRTRELEEGETLHKGIDVSEFQGSINWQKAADSGVEFAFIRCAYRGYGQAGTLCLDFSYAQNIQAAQAAGIQVGVYIYSQATTEAEAREEARFLMNAVADFEIDLPLSIDYEYADGSNGGLTGRLYNANLTKEEATAICNAFCDEIERNGYESLVYANLSMLNNNLNSEDLGRIWLAQYDTYADFTGNYEYWQFTDQGTVSGISGYVDLDYWFKPASTDEETEVDSDRLDPNLETEDEQDVSSDDSDEESEEESEEDEENRADQVLESDGLPFEDVLESDWYYEDVLRAYEAGIIQGTNEEGTKFSPNRAVMREEFVTMLYRMADEPLVSEVCLLPDVSEEAYYFSAACWATQTGIVLGYGLDDGTAIFAPTDNITRQDLVLMLYRIAGEPSVEQDLSQYADADDISDYALDAVMWAVNSNILRGFEDEESGLLMLGPHNSTTRSETCALLMRFWDIVDVAVLGEEDEAAEPEIDEENPEDTEEAENSADAEETENPEGAEETANPEDAEESETADEPKAAQQIELPQIWYRV